MFSEEKLFETRNSNKLKNLFSQTHPTILNLKSCINKLSIKMFIKEFKVTYKKNVFNFTPITLSVVKQLSLDITQLFARYCPMSGANIHVSPFHIFQNYQEVLNAISMKLRPFPTTQNSKSYKSISFPWNCFMVYCLYGKVSYTYHNIVCCDFSFRKTSYIEREFRKI